tara:strand:- start:219 stop:464 length:246 start_codon:yes stop_codon:yes gene_type:complete
MKNKIEYEVIVKKNLEIIMLTSRIDSLLSTNLDLTEQITELKQDHLDFITTLQEEIKDLTRNLQDVKMDMARNELDSRLRD